MASSASSLASGAGSVTAGAGPLRLALVAGERSGDLLGARVMTALRRHLGEANICFEGIGGQAMTAEGLTSLYPMERLAVMGLVEPLGRLPELLSLRRRLVAQWSEAPPDLFLGIDAPDFNLGLARRVRKNNVATAQLVSPTVWAWRPGRIHTVARAVEHILCLFPFEPALYRDVPVRAHYVGHPLTREFAEVPSRESVREALDIDPRRKVIALLPGSRRNEVAQLGAQLIRAGLLLKSRDSQRELVMPAAGPERLAQCRELLADAGATDRVRLLDGQSRDAMIAADVVCLASGTATLEAMLLRRPMVVAYRVAPISWKLLSHMAVTQHVALPNILAGDAVVPEFLQDDMTAPALALAAEGLLHEGPEQVDALAEARNALATDFDSEVSRVLGAVLDRKGHGGEARSGV